MAERNLTSSWGVTDTEFFYELADKSGAKKRLTADLTAILAKPVEAAKAVASGLRLIMREATGGKDFGEAVETLTEFIEAISAGQYPKRSRAPGESRSSPLIVAIARVLFSGDAAQAQADYDAEIEALCKAGGIDPDPDSDDADGQKALRKIKAGYRKTLVDNPAIKRELLALEIEAQQAALARKQEELAKTPAA